MKFQEGLISLGFIVLSALATFFVFRRTSGRTIVDRIPLFLTSAVPLLYMGLASLPFAFEPIFARIIGHNIRDVYQFPKRPDGLEFSESWWLARWQGPIQSAVIILVPIGIAWALINAAIDRQRKANLLAFWVGVGLMLTALFLSAGIAQLF